MASEREVTSSISMASPARAANSSRNWALEPLLV
jgi:hypothetical protein